MSLISDELYEVILFYKLEWQLLFVYLLESKRWNANKFE